MDTNEKQRKNSFIVTHRVGQGREKKTKKKHIKHFQSYQRHQPNDYYSLSTPIITSLVWPTTLTKKLQFLYRIRRVPPNQRKIWRRNVRVHLLIILIEFSLDNSDVSLWTEISIRSIYFWSSSSYHVKMMKRTGFLRCEKKNIIPNVNHSPNRHTKQHFIRLIEYDGIQLRKPVT